MAFKSQLYIPNKLEYIDGSKRPNVECIICSIAKRDPQVTNLMVACNELVGCSVNLYPYNSGHVFIFPVRHIEDPRNLTEDEEIEMSKIRNLTMNILDELYHPQGFNIGFNVGIASGASIKHLHQHIVPRFNRELGFIDIIGGAKIIIEDPRSTLEKLRDKFRKYGQSI